MVVISYLVIFAEFKIFWNIPYPILFMLCFKTHVYQKIILIYILAWYLLNYVFLFFNYFRSNFIKLSYFPLQNIYFKWKLNHYSKLMDINLSYPWFTQNCVYPINTKLFSLFLSQILSLMILICSEAYNWFLSPLVRISKTRC